MAQNRKDAADRTLFGTPPRASAQHGAREGASLSKSDLERIKGREAAEKAEAAKVARLRALRLAKEAEDTARATEAAEAARAAKRDQATRKRTKVAASRSAAAPVAAAAQRDD